MAYVAQQYRQDSPSDDSEFPEPNYPYLYAPRSEAGYTTPAASQAPLPPITPSHHSNRFSHVNPRPRGPQRAYSDTSQSSGGDSYITPSLSASQAGHHRMRAMSHARSYASPRSRATSFVSREDLRNIPNGPHTYTPRSKPPALLASPSVLSHPQAPTNYTSSTTSSPKVAGHRRLRGVLKKPRPIQDDDSYISTSSAPDVIDELPPPIVMPSADERSFPVPPMMDSSSPAVLTDYRRSRAPSMAPPSDVTHSAVTTSTRTPRTRFSGNAEDVSRHLKKPWDARSPVRLDSATRSAPAFNMPGMRSINLIVAGLPWSVHVRAGASRSRSQRHHDHITVGDVIDSVYHALNKSLTRTDVRAASSETKKRIARAAAAAERESERGRKSAQTGKPSAARRIDFLGSRIWFMGLEKNDDFARREGYGLTDGELKKVWVMRFSSSATRTPTVMV